MQTTVKMLAILVMLGASAGARAQTYDAAKDFSITANPNGVWHYMSADAPGAAPVLLAKKNTGPLENKGGAVSYWNTGAGGWDAYQGIFTNLTAAPVTVSAGLVVQPGALVLHPGNKSGSETVLRFLAPAAGEYTLQATFTAMDAQAKKTQVRVRVNGKDTLSQGLQGPKSTANFTGKEKLEAGQTVDFVVDNGGDGFGDDAVQISASVVRAPVTHDAAKDFSLSANPNGVWSYMSGASPVALTKKNVGPLEPNAGAVSYWNTGAASWDAYHGVFSNLGAAPVTVSKGLVVQPGALVLHPGNKSGLPAVVRFTAPSAGEYALDATFTAIDEQAKKTQVLVRVNGAEVLNKSLSGPKATESFKSKVKLEAGQTVDFVVDNGGDGFSDDAVQLSAVLVR